MHICVVGTGYVGLVSGVCLAELGHEVVCVDVDDNKISSLKKGDIPIYEPGLQELVSKNVENERLTFTTNLVDGLREAEVVLNAVGTPPDERRRVELRYVYSVAKEVGELLDHYIVFVNKSTVPVGTANTVERIIQENLKKKITFDVASNPEFLREGAAIDNFMDPDRIIIGVKSKKAQKFLEELYKPLTEKGSVLLAMDIKSAELVKYASNAFLATKISFINEIAQLCEQIGANVSDVADGMGLDSRIGKKFLQPGPGYGGSCFPKDVEGLVHTAYEHNTSLKILESVKDVNYRQQLIAVNKLRNYFDSFNGVTVALWGLAFKENTDDIRESSAIITAKVQCYDPEANENAQKYFQHNNVIHFAKDKFTALKGADALVLMTHWDEFKTVRPDEIAKKLVGNIVIDTRNIWDKKEFEKAGLVYEGIGTK